MAQLSEQLLDNSQEALVLAIEVYNKPTVQYRLETFCFLFCNAWELLLKGRILEVEGNESAIQYDDEPQRTLSLRDCLKQIYENEKDPVRCNVEDITEIRDAAVHFIIPELEAVYQGLIQSGIVNYAMALNEWFDKSILDRCNPSMLTLVGDVHDIEPTKLRDKYGNEIVDFVESEVERIDETEEKLDDLGYRIPIEYKLKLTKKAEDADISLVSGDSDQTGVVLEVAKDLSRTHPYRQTDAIQKINSRLNEDQQINSYGFQAFLHKNKIKKRAQYHHQIEKPKTHRYSESLIDLVVDKIEQHEGYIQRARESYSRYRKEQQGN